MWIFKNDAFVSIVQDRVMPDQLWVRARIRGDLERFFDNDPGLTVLETPDADYRFRVAADRLIVENLVAEAVHSIDYENFKSSITTDDAGEARHDAYLDVWRAMLRYQTRELSRRPVGPVYSRNSKQWRTAFEAGLKAYETEEGCPYTNQSRRDAWYEGWDAAQQAEEEDLMDLYTDVHA